MNKMWNRFEYVKIYIQDGRIVGYKTVFTDIILYVFRDVPRYLRMKSGKAH
jgi:hypothetical protein